MTMLKFLEMGGTLTFPSGYYLGGDPASGYIDVGSPFGSDGLWSLDKEGLKNALADAKKYEKSLQETE